MTQENKMGTMPVNKLLISMSLPMIISMLVQAMYNIVDSVFVAQISEKRFNCCFFSISIAKLDDCLCRGNCSWRSMLYCHVV